MADEPMTPIREAADLQGKMLAGVQHLRKLNEDDVQFGPTPKEAVFRNDHVVLYRYLPKTEKRLKTPLLIVYALVNRPYMVDLQEDRSLVRALLDEGIDVYLIDWGYPGPAERWLTLDDYVNDYVDSCVEYLRDHYQVPKINVLGICQGGALSLCYTALHQDKVKNLTTMVVPVDYAVEATQTTGLLNAWTQGLDVDEMVDALGNVPGDLMNFGYLMLRPFQLNLGKYLGLTDVFDDEMKLINFLRMEKWIFDSPDQAGEAFRQFIKDFYQQNKLIKGEVVLGDEKVNLQNITGPVLNIYAEQDHLVPPASSVALKRYVGTSDYTVKSFKTGHIGMYVSGKVQRDLPVTIAGWLRERE